jgi:ribonuclease HI
MPLDPHAVHIHTDGSCYGNPGGSGGAAAYVEFPDHLDLPPKQILDFGCEETSNNRMELLACIRALEWVRKNKPWSGVNRVLIVSDSRYVLDNLPRARGWKRNRWRNLHGEPKQNSDLWRQLLGAHVKVGMRVDFEWQAGKTSPILKSVDKAAKVAAKRGGIEQDRGFKSGKVSRSMVRGSAEIFPAKGQTAIIRPYRKNTPIKGENQIRFDLFTEDKKIYSDSYYAYAIDSLTAELHRQHLYRVRFNNNLRNARIEEIIEEVFLP